jgi:hypothetical protein
MSAQPPLQSLSDRILAAIDDEIGPYERAGSPVLEGAVAAVHARVITELPDAIADLILQHATVTDQLFALRVAIEDSERRGELGDALRARLTAILNAPPP